MQGKAEGYTSEIRHKRRACTQATSICFGVIHVDEFEVSDVSEQGLRGVDGDEQQRLNVNRKILDALEGTPRLQMPSCGPGMHRANR
jgi:hypothetical protein